MSKYLVLAAVAIATSACANSAASSSANAAEEPAIVGGWSPIAVDNADVKAAAAFAATQYAGPNGTVAQITRAESQVVAGMNYRMALVLSDGRKPIVTVWKKLDGSMELISVVDPK